MTDCLVISERVLTGAYNTITPLHLSRTDHLRKVKES